ncbi:MAG: endonuclease [Candidatus Omnitrophica bacterium]|nr:endonuclease [Candidatus Omnitrophota bacterium]
MLTKETSDTKLKSDISESFVVTKLLKLGCEVLRPVGDRLPYDLVIAVKGKFIKIQIKSAWHCQGSYFVDTRRTKTNRRRMLRALYGLGDFDFAICYIENLDICYVLPIVEFLSYKSAIALVESEKRQRKPKSHIFREAWHLLE